MAEQTVTELRLEVDDERSAQLQAKLEALKLAATKGSKRRAVKRALHAGRRHSTSEEDDNGVSILDEHGHGVANDGPGRIRLMVKKKRKRRAAGNKRGRQRGGQEDSDNDEDDDDDDDIERRDFAAADQAAVAVPAATIPINNDDASRRSPSPAASYLELPTTAISRPDSTTTEFEDSDLELPTSNEALALADRATVPDRLTKSDGDGNAAGLLAVPRPSLSRASSRSSASSSSSSNFLTTAEVDLQTPFAPSPAERPEEQHPFNQGPGADHHIQQNVAALGGADDSPIKRTDTLRSVNVDAGRASAEDRRRKRHHRGSSFRLSASLPFTPEGGSPRKPGTPHRRSGSGAQGYESRTQVAGEGDDELAPLSPRLDRSYTENSLAKSRSRAGSDLFLDTQGGVGSFIRRTATLTKRKLPFRSNSQSEPAQAEASTSESPYRDTMKKRRKARKVIKSEAEQLKEAAEHIVDSMHAAGYKHEELMLREERVTEVLYENQRGLFLLGSRYGSGALLPGDPAKWAKYDAK